MRTIFITTLGCKVNQFESETLSGELQAKGYLTTKDPEEADILVVNTCTVTQKASMQSRQSIRRIHRENPQAKIIVTGCYAQTEKEEILKIDGVTKVIPNSEKEQLTQHIDALCETTSGKDPLNEKNILFQKDSQSSRTRPFLKIQDGCNTFCTYCIVPYARGRSQSMPFETAKKNFIEIAKTGFGEIVLTGIHLGAYGLDLTPKTTLFELLADLTHLDLNYRIRLSSIEPQELSPQIIDLAKRSQEKSVTLCRHFHVPLQSGDDTILNRMHRPYTSNYFKNLVQNIKTDIPDAGIGADVLIGFPGETDHAFENTYHTIETLPITYLHVFPFSARPKTPAFNYPDKVKSEVIKKRAKQLRELGIRKKRTFYESLSGNVCEVIVESKRDPKTGMLKALTSHYVPILFEGDDTFQNQRIHVKIEKVTASMNVHGVITG